MWQRKQTIFMLLTACCMGLVIFFPIWIAQADNIKLMLYPLHYSIQNGDEILTQYYPYCFCALLASASASIAIIEITKFNNRLLQLKLGTLNSLLMAGVMVLATYFTIQLIKSHKIAGYYGVAIWIIFVALISNMIAGWFIRKDEKLINESNRIR